MSLKLIKTAQQTTDLSDIAEQAEAVKKALGVEQLDEGLVSAIRAMNYDRLAKRSGKKADAAVDDMDGYSVTDPRRNKPAAEFEKHTDAMIARRAKAKKLRENDEFSLQPQQIVDQVVNHLAPAAGMNGQHLTPQQFMKLAQEFRLELEDHYDEVYSASEWRQLTQAAFAQYTQAQQQGYEDEEQGWPDEDQNEFDREEEQFDFGLEPQHDERDRLPEENEEAPRQSSNDDMTQEQRGWYDGSIGIKPRFPNDTDYMSGHTRAEKLIKPLKNPTAEEEEDHGRGSMLKSLLSQRKEVSKKASEAMKRIEAEGAKAFHEFRMKHEKAPYDQGKQAEEFTAWSKGWSKAASQHYATEPVEPKKKAKKK